jgi:FPC/CPF motif-containing protein YcgG
MDEEDRSRADATMELSVAPPIAARVREDFVQFVSRPDYPCLGARAALRQNGCRVAVYGPMGSSAATAALAADLATFAEESEDAARRGPVFVSFVALFVSVAFDSEAAFEAALWHQLTLLDAAAPVTPWAADASDDPDDPHFAFSIAGRAFFVVGLHPESSRLARRFAWPALVFNPHAQFQRLRAEQRFEGLRVAIRARDVALQGDVNPNLADVGERSEARQYSGRSVGDAWRCPFHHRGA